MLSNQSTNDAVLPYFVPQGTLLPSGTTFDLTAFTFVPNAGFTADAVTAAAPPSSRYAAPGLAHLTLALAWANALERATDFQGRPVAWTARDLDLGTDLTHVALYVVTGPTILSVSVIDLGRTPAGKTADASLLRLTSLETAVRLLGNGGLEPIELMKKMKDSGF